MPLPGFLSPHPLAGPSLLRVLLLLFLLRGDPSHGLAYRVLWDRWQGGIVKPQPLETSGNPDGKNQRQLGAKQEKERTLTRDTYPRSGRIAGWVRAPASSLPTVPATRLWRSSTGREAKDVCEPSKSTPGFISESGNRRSAKGSTLRRWVAVTTPAAVRPPSRNLCKASRRGWSFSCFSCVAPHR
jgi:hypothetical protein